MTTPMPDREASIERLRKVRGRVLEVQRHVRHFLEERGGVIEKVHPLYRPSVENLLAYVGLRQLDHRALQLELGEWGLSSLGRSEGHVLSSLKELLDRIEDSLVARGVPVERDPGPEDGGPMRRPDAEQLLHTHTRALLGPRPRDRHVLIMVTAPDVPPSEEECEALIRAGMNVLRINTAHGSPEIWRRTAEAMRKVAVQLDHPLRILADLEGPKVRIASLGPGAAVVRYRPKKDALGRVAHSLRVPLIGLTSPAPASLGVAAPLRVPEAWLECFRVGDVLKTRDTRDRKRAFRITGVAPGAASAEIDRTCYLTEGSIIVWCRDGAILDRFPIPELPRSPASIDLRVGDRFQLLLDGARGHPGVRSPDDPRKWIVAPKIGLTLDGIGLTLEAEQRVMLDDGKLEAVVETVDGAVATARVVKTSDDRVRIRGEKGVNFPDTVIRASALSEADREVLPAVLEIADGIGLSFVRTPADLREAMAVIRGIAGERSYGLVVKLETADALKALPEIVLEAQHHYPVGLMIARGDLAVEVGFERLAELQQEILWFAEAAHLPVVWATQVLDTLARTGIPSRAEVTDASMSVQAECVMLNKGPHVADACRMLEAIIHKMEQHQFKKRNLYRPLKISLDMKPDLANG